MFIYMVSPPFIGLICVGRVIYYFWMYTIFTCNNLI